MRVITAFNKMLALPGAWVRDVAFGAEGVVVTVALKTRKPVCSGCGTRGLKIKEHRTKRWRHLDLGAVGARSSAGSTPVLPGVRRRVRDGAVGASGLAVHAGL